MSSTVIKVRGELKLGFFVIENIKNILTKGFEWGEYRRGEICNLLQPKFEANFEPHCT